MSSSNSDAMNTKLAAMIDTHEIKEVAHRFARGLDRCDRELIESCFHEDGIDDHGFFKGSASEFCDWVLEELKKYETTQHLIATQNAKLNGNSAVCESYFYAYHHVPTPDGTREVIASGRYVDTMEKRDGEWKITHRLAVFDWTHGGAATPLPAPENDPRNFGKSYPDDVSYATFAKIK